MFLDHNIQVLFYSNYFSIYMYILTEPNNIQVVCLHSLILLSVLLLWNSQLPPDIFKKNVALSRDFSNYANFPNLNIWWYIKTNEDHCPDDTFLSLYQSKLMCPNRLLSNLIRLFVFLFMYFSSSVVIRYFNKNFTKHRIQSRLLTK